MLALQSPLSPSGSQVSVDEVARSIADADPRVGNLSLVPVSFREANSYVALFHRHHGKVRGHKFSIGAAARGALVGVAIIGRPVARMRQDGGTVEVTRLCTDGWRNACSFLYGRTARAAFALGYCRIGTYILESEDGASLRAAGWTRVHVTSGGSWSRTDRPRVDECSTEPKVLYERLAGEGCNPRPGHLPRQALQGPEGGVIADQEVNVLLALHAPDSGHGDVAWEEPRSINR